MLYFAYGSNMSVPRIQQRINGAKQVDIARLAGYQLRFHKRGRDGSGKCDAFYTGDPMDFVWGVLFQLEASHKVQLDQFEGVGQGYLDKTINVINAKGAAFSAFMYYATEIDDRLHPFSWYKIHVVNGAKAAGLPAAYIEMLESVVAIEDVDINRTQQELSIYSNTS